MVQKEGKTNVQKMHIANSAKLSSQSWFFYVIKEYLAQSRYNQPYEFQETKSHARVRSYPSSCQKDSS